MGSMKAWVLKNLDYVSWDRVGMWLSFLCAVHCVLTPLMILSLPILARYYLAHPLMHLLLALMILPVGLVAFVLGYRHHRQKSIFFYGIPGLLIVSFVPYIVHSLHIGLNEQLFMIVGSGLLIFAHWKNRRACRDCALHHSH